MLRWNGEQECQPRIVQRVCARCRIIFPRICWPTNIIHPHKCGWVGCASNQPLAILDLQCRDGNLDTFPVHELMAGKVQQLLE